MASIFGSIKTVHDLDGVDSLHLGENITDSIEAYSDKAIDGVIQAGFGEMASMFMSVVDLVMTFLKGKKPPWSLSIWDKLPTAGGPIAADSSVKLIGQFPIQQITYSYSNLKQDDSFLNDKSRPQLNGEGATGFSFTAPYVAEDRTKNLNDIIQVVRYLNSKHPSLSRKPILKFREYDEPEVVCLLDSVQISKGVRFPNGRLAKVEFTFSFSVYEPRPKDTYDATTLEKSTSYHRLVAGETYESLALDYYGDPELGHAIRQTNAKVEEEAGDQVKILPREHSFVKANKGLTSPVFLDDDWTDELERICLDRENRGDSYQTHFDRGEVEE